MIALLGSCSVEGDAEVATKGRWDEASKGAHLRIRFAKPRSFVLNGEEEVEAEEIVVPLSATAMPEYIYVRNGNGYRAFAKYEAATCLFIQGRVESMRGVEAEPDWILPRHGSTSGFPA